MYDYLKEIPPTYKDEYENLVTKLEILPCKSTVKYQLIIMAYKEEKLIGGCVESLINQTASPDEFEVLIINNCSTEEEFDNTEKVVEEKLRRYKYNNIHLINVKFLKEIASSSMAAKYGMDIALHRWKDYPEFNRGIVAYFGADNVFENHFVWEVLKTFNIPSKYDNPYQLYSVGLGEDRIDVLITHCDGNWKFAKSDSLIDIGKLDPYIERVDLMNKLLGEWYYNYFDIIWGVKKGKKVHLDERLIYRPNGSPIWPKTFRASIYDELGGVEIQAQEEQAIIVKAVINDCVVKFNDLTNFTHIHRLETPRVPDGSMTQVLNDSFKAYVGNSELKVYQLDYWTMRNNIEKYFYEKTFYENWNPTFFSEKDLNKIIEESGESYLYFKNKFIYQFQGDINKIYKKISINKVINDIKKEL